MLNFLNKVINMASEYGIALFILALVICAIIWGVNGRNENKAAQAKAAIISILIATVILTNAAKIVNVVKSASSDIDLQSELDQYGGSGEGDGGNAETPAGG